MALTASRDFRLPDMGATSPSFAKECVSCPLPGSLPRFLSDVGILAQAVGVERTGAVLLLQAGAILHVQPGCCQATG